MGRGPGRPRKDEPRQAMAPAEVNYDTGPEDPAPKMPSREAMREVRDDRREGQGRQRRRPLGTPEQRLGARVPKGMVGRWINDTPGRIERALEAGYRFISDNGEEVEDRNGGRREIVGSGRDGGALHAYLMAIPEEFHKEDQLAKRARNQEIEQAILRGTPQQANEQDRANFYQPEGMTNIRSGTR